MIAQIKELTVIRKLVLNELNELQADLLDFNDDELVDCREVMLKRVNLVLELLEESDEDNQW